MLVRPYNPANVDERGQDHGPQPHSFFLHIENRLGGQERDQGSDSPSSISAIEARE